MCVNKEMDKMKTVTSYYLLLSVNNNNTVLLFSPDISQLIVRLIVMKLVNRWTALISQCWQEKH